MNGAENYLRDMLELLLARAREARSQCAERKAKQAYGTEFECGRAVAYYEVLATLINQLDTFGLTREQVGLTPDFEVEKELL